MMAAMHIHTDGDRQPVVSPSPSCYLSTDCKFVVGTVHRLTNDPFDSCSICVRVEETHFTTGSRDACPSIDVKIFLLDDESWMSCNELSSNCSTTGIHDFVSLR